MTESQKIRITQIADIVAEQQHVELPEGARPTGLDRLAYVLEKAAGITPVGGRTPLQRIFDCFNSGKVFIASSPEVPVSLAVKTMPTKTTYVVGEEIDPTGLSLTLTYSTGDTKVIESGYIIEPEELEAEGTQEIAVHYEEEGVTVSTAFDVTVEAAPVVDEPETPEEPSEDTEPAAEEE